jgi:hypothetical protein
VIILLFMQCDIIIQFRVLRVLFVPMMAGASRFPGNSELQEVSRLMMLIMWQ